MKRTVKSRADFSSTSSVKPTSVRTPRTKRQKTTELSIVPLSEPVDPVVPVVPAEPVEPSTKTRVDTTIDIHLKPVFDDESTVRRAFEAIYDPSSGYSVDIDGNFINVYLTHTDTDTVKNRCLELVLQNADSPIIYVLHLDNCVVPRRAPELGRGGELLKKLVHNIRKYSGFETVHVVIDLDASGIYIHDKRVPLNILQLLTTGETWYNKMGFKETGYTANKKAIDAYIEQPVKLAPKSEDKKRILASLGYIPKTNMVKRDFFNRITQRIKILGGIPKEEAVKEIEYYNELLRAEDKGMRDIFKSMGTNKFKQLEYEFE